MDTARSRSEALDLSRDLGDLRFDLVITGCRLTPDGQAWDVVDFQVGVLTRWRVPQAPMPFGVDAFRTMLPDSALSVTAGSVYGGMLTPHVAQLSPHGHLVVSYLNGLCIQVLDIRTGALRTLDRTPDGRPWQHSATGGFSNDGKEFYFVRWPLDHSIAFSTGMAESVSCQLCRLRLDDMAVEIVAEVDYLDEVHQITPSGDERYLVFTTFNSRPVVPMPKCAPDEDQAGYHRAYASGLRARDMITYDRQTGRHWRTRIPVPRPAHFEVDPLDPHVFYVSAHNFADSVAGVLLNGPAALYRMRILDGRTVIEAEYSAPDLFRVTQHMPFVHDGKILVAVTNIPNKMEILDGETMRPWRRVTLFDAPEIDFDATGYVRSPAMPEMCLSLSPSACGRYIVLQSSEKLVIYDIAADSLLEAAVLLHANEKFSVVGHNRPVARDVPTRG